MSLQPIVNAAVTEHFPEFIRFLRQPPAEATERTRTNAAAGMVPAKTAADAAAAADIATIIDSWNIAPYSAYEI